MKKKNLILSVLSVLVLSANGFAMGNGVEKILPADASNVKVAEVKLDSALSSETLISDGNDGPAYQQNFAPALSVKVTYDSKNHKDDETALDNSNDPAAVVVGGPALFFSLPVTADQAAAIKAKTLDPASLVAISVTPQTLQFDKQSYGPNCRFDNDSAGPTDDSCIIHTPKSEVRPVLTIDLK